MSLESMTRAVRAAVGDRCSVENTIKIRFGGGEGVIYIDGRSRPSVVHNDDADSDLTLVLGLDDFERIMARELSGKKLMLAGRMKIKGDIRIAMRMDKVLKLE